MIACCKADIEKLVEGFKFKMTFYQIFLFQKQLEKRNQ